MSKPPGNDLSFVALKKPFAIRNRRTEPYLRERLGTQSVGLRIVVVSPHFELSSRGLFEKEAFDTTLRPKIS